MNRTQAERLMKVHDLIGTAWGADHFDLDHVGHGDLQGAADAQTLRCGAAGCVSGFLPLVNKRIEWPRFGVFHFVGRSFSYIGIAEHREGFGLELGEADHLCNPDEYDGWTRAKVRARARKLVAKYHPDLAAATDTMRYCPE